MGRVKRKTGLEPYVPTIAADWLLRSPERRWMSTEGTLVFVDVSGFTMLSERLARRGRIGAEELTVVLNKVFGDMLAIVFERGGSLLKFGGDALLLLFDSRDHVMQAVAATIEMRAALRQASRERTSVGRIDLKMSSGIHTGEVDFFLVGESHRELIVTGSVASHTTEMEATAEAGEILVSRAVAQQLPKGFAIETKGNGYLMRKQKVDCPRCGPVLRESGHSSDLASLVPERLRDHLLLGITDSEHRIASVGFLKFSGIDEMLAADGPIETAAALHHFLSVVQSSVDEEGVSFLATDIDANGGKVILAAGVPASQHDDEGRILRAMRRILDAPQKFHLRAGINRGHVFTGDVGTSFRRTFTVMGDTVNLAARLMASAGSGQLYASPQVLDESSTLFRTEALEPFRVKGKEALVQAYEVCEEIGTRPPDMTHELPFHGREPEMQMLISIVTTCAQVGRGGMMTIVGDTGIGKSRLIAEVLERCPGLATLLLKAEPNGMFSPYWTFRDPLRRQLGVERSDNAAMGRQLQAVVRKIAPDLVPLVPLLGDVLHIEIEGNDTTKEIDPRFRPDRTADAVIELLDSLHANPLVIVAEDGQWLDEASRNLLRMLGAAAETRPWTTVVTLRDAPESTDEFGNHLALKPLDDETIRAIANEVMAAAPLRPHETDRIVARVGGNPLFLSEILNVIRETGDTENMPDSLDAVVSTQIDTLPPLARQTLRYSAVLGSSFPTPVLSEFLAPDDMEIDEATRTILGRFIESDGDDRLRFAHAVVQDVAYRGLPYRRRRELHARAGEVVERMAGDDTGGSAEFLAYHFSEAGRHEKAWQYSQIAADKARSSYANTEAAAHYQRAVEAARHLPSAPPEAVFDVWVNLSEVRELSGQMEAARSALSRAREEGVSDPLKDADLLLRRAAIWVNSGDTTHAKRSTSRARRGLDPGDERHIPMLARLDALDASIRATEGDPVAAAAFASSAVARGESAGEREALARAYSVMDYANFMTGKTEDWLGPKAIEIYESLGSIERNVNVMNNLGAYAFWGGRWDEAIEWYERAVEAADRSGNVLDGALARVNIAEVLIAQRRPEHAGELLEEAQRVNLSSNAGQFTPLVILLRARLESLQGDGDRAISILEDLIAEGGVGRDTPWTQESLVDLALLHARLGDPKRAEAILDDPRLRTTRTTSPWLRAAGVIASENGKSPAGLEFLERATEAASIDEDLYQELLALECILVYGGEPEPEQTDRLAELRGRLGVHATPLFST